MDIKEIRRKNLRRLIDEKFERKQANLATAIDVQPDYISRCLSGKKGIGEDLARKLEAISGKEKYWLDLDHDAVSNKTKEEGPSYVLGSFDAWDSSTPLRDDEVELPFFREVELSAGSGRHEVIENHGCKLRFSKSTLRKQGVSAKYAACVTVSGESMQPVLPDGCVVGIDTNNTTIKNGDMYAIDHHGELRVKVLYRLVGGGIRIKSYNDEYPDEMYSQDDIQAIKILGRVFWYSVLI